MAIGSVGYTPGSFYARFRARESIYQEAERWRQNRAAQTQQYLSKNAALAEAFGSAFVNQVQGTAMLAAQAAQNRIKAAAAALRSRADKLA